MFAGIVDYAGLFPPAGLGMSKAVRAYHQYRESADRSLLARFVVAANQLDEFTASLNSLELQLSLEAPWRLSVVTGALLPQELERIATFQRHWEGRGVLVDALEHRVASVEQIEGVGELVPPSLIRFLEVPSKGPYAELVQAIGRIGANAKVRTGGTSPEFFPEASDLVHFLAAVTTHHVPFKATAGLHHAFRGVYPLTYLPDAKSYPMFGFVNVLLATAELIRSGNRELAQMLLEEDDPVAFECSSEIITWRDQHYSADELISVRRHAFLGFGSCSFREPVDELRAQAVA